MSDKQIKTYLIWSAIIMFLVGLKLILSYYFPGLRTPGELVLSGGLLLIYSLKTTLVWRKIKLD